MYEKHLPLFTYFEVFLVAFEEAFGEYDIVWATTTKICALAQGSHVGLIYAFDIM